MKSIIAKLRSEYTSEYTLKNYKEPKIYHGGSEYDLSKRWYVYYSFRNPETGLMKRQPPIYNNINREYKSKKERLIALEELREDVLELLEQGYSPYKAQDNQNRYTISSAIEFAVDIKEKVLSESSFDLYKIHSSGFLKFLTDKKLKTADVKNIDKKIVVSFLNKVLKETMPITEIMQKES